jgi:hypothetical protein
MKQFCYVIVNNAGHSWLAVGPGEPSEGNQSNAHILPELLQNGWVPIRETPMGGGTSHLAHSLVLLEHPPKSAERAPGRPGRKRKQS